MESLRPFARARAILLMAIATLALVIAARAGYGHWRARHADTAFAALLQQANSQDGLARSAASPPSRVPIAPLVVLVRDITHSGSIAPYHVKPDLPWPIAFADGPRDGMLGLLVDRILVDVQSYRPSGEDYQVVLHCTLIAWGQHRTLLEYSVRGSEPSDRAGLPRVFGLFDRIGSEPWPEAGARISGRLAPSQTATDHHLSRDSADAHAAPPSHLAAR